MKNQRSIIRCAALFCAIVGAASLISYPAESQTATAQPANYGAYEWVDSDRTAPELTQFKTFQSKTIKGEVSYLVYLPPGYEQQKDTRYPVLYVLPASGGTPKQATPQVANRVDAAIRAGKIGPMIIIGVNGLRGNTMYCDSRDGKWPLETVIVQDLIPHVDATYHTIASREARAVDGFSMGGFGAAHLGFKFPDLFGVISIMAPPLLGPDLKQHLPAQAWSRLFPLAMNSDLEYFRANDPFTLVEKNADGLRDRTVIRLVCHMENEEWLWPRCEQLHELMTRLKIQHEFYFLTNVKGHNPIQCMDTMGDSAFNFFSSSLAGKKSAATGPRASSASTAPAVTASPQPAAKPASWEAPGPSSSASAIPTQTWETLPDGSEGRATEFHGVDGIAIAAYIRKPVGPGPFPTVVWMHGGRDSVQATLGLGRSQKSPVEDLVKAGFAIYAADFRHSDKIAIVPIEFDDTVEAVKAARALPFVDPKHVGYMGHSHGAQVGTRVISRVDLCGAVICAPAAMDLIEVNKAFQRGDKLVPVLKKMIEDMEKQYGASAEELEKDPAKYGYRSGLTEAPQVRCPLLIISGRDDDNVPAPMIDLYVARLRAVGKQVETYQPDHGPHGFYFGRPEIPETQEAARRAVDFFKRQFGR
jgi:endo-1,4-beta-xylanase